MLALGARGVVDPFYTGVFAPLPQQTIGRIGASSSYEAITIRLLCGCADIVDSTGALLLSQRTNLMVLGTSAVKVRTESGVKQTLRRLGVDSRALDAHLRRNLTHQPYFRQIALELVEYFVRSYKGEHTLAFLHAYRLLERISFVFPLLYAVRSASYPGAFTVLKDYFKGGADSELALLRKFQDSSIDSADRQSPTDFDFSGLSAAVANSSFAVVKRSVPDDDVVSDVFPIITVRSGALLSLMINLRNRYFHFSASNPSNISVLEIGDSDEFFGLVNPPMINWISVIFLAVLSERIR